MSKKAVKRSVDSFHESDCEIFIGTAANGRYVEKPCTCGLDAALAVERRAGAAEERERIRAGLEEARQSASEWTDPEYFIGLATADGILDAALDIP